jgi:hypothetical protein
MNMFAVDSDYSRHRLEEEATSNKRKERKGAKDAESIFLSIPDK